MKSIKPHWLFFTGLTIFYLAFSPGTIFGMGYMGENIEACLQIISNLGEWATFQYASTRVSWPRHGLYELIFELPFMLAGRTFLGPSPEMASLPLSLQPVIFSASLCTLLFVWIRRMTGSLAWAFVLSAATAFSTMVWPYAYIGLETTQSLFLLITGFLAIEMREKRAWKSAILFSVSAAMAISLKSNGVFLGPAVAYLFYLYFKPELDAARRGARGELLKPAVAAAVVIGLYALNAYMRSLAPVWGPGVFALFAHLNSESLVTIFLNMFSFFGSTNKGLLIFSPIIILSILALGRAFRSRPEVAAFALLALFGLLAGCSFFFFWADETWGPRYLHSSVAPLVLLIAAGRSGVPFRLRTAAPLVALALLGAFISFLGISFSYGALHKAATLAGQSTIESLQSDPSWNHIRFNLKLLGIRTGGGREQISEPVNWPPEPHWWYGKPTDAPEIKTVDLRDYAEPQPLIFRNPDTMKGSGEKVVRLIYINLVWIGGLLLALAAYACLKREEARPARPRGVRKAGAAD